MVSQDDDPPEAVRRIRQALLARHRETIVTTIEAGRAVDRTLSEPVTDADEITGELEAELAQRSLAGSLLQLLETAAEVIETTIQGQPVPAPPYLVVTSCGPICRGTLASDRRLVIELALWTVEREPVQYRFRDPTPEACLQVALR